MNIDDLPIHRKLYEAERAELMGEHGAVMAVKIGEWIAIHDDNRPFHRRDVERDILFPISKSDPEHNRFLGEQMNRALRLMVGAGIIERAPNKSFGWYRAVNKELVEQDVQHAEGEAVDIWLPLGLSDVVKLFPGDIAIFAGVPNVGKSAFTLNVAKENAAKDFEVHYFNSEMSSIELRERIEMFGCGWSAWNGVHFYRRSENFHDVVFPGKNIVNIIDFLQVHTDFYAIGATLFEIHKRLNDSICIINMQKNPGNDTALGGFRTLELPRLAIALEYGKCKVVKAKAWRDKSKNPNGSVCQFKLVGGCNLIPHDRIDFKWRTTLEQQQAGVE
uniref:Putative helicase n=2 Tax=viral metagenome TaxID=1070528 RepID=A0A6M3LEG8_9ZZZZ